MATRLSRSALVGLMLLGACGADDVDAPISLAGACETEERLGGFRVESFDALEPAFSSISGSVKDAINPIEIGEELAADGGCRLLRRNNAFCEPGCPGGQLCTFEGTCVPFPAGLDLGTVTVSGLATDALALEPLMPGNNYSATDIPHPLFAPGDEIRLRTGGGESLALDGRGSEPLVVDGDGWVVTEGAAIAIAWTPPATANETTIGLRLSIDQHGTTPVTLVCELEDSGDAVVPSSIVDALFAAGVSGFPNASLERRTADSASYAGGCADLLVAHPVRHPASVSGHTPCNGPNQCPAGQTCDLGAETCVPD